VYTDCDWDGNPNTGPISVVVDFTTNKQTLLSNIDAITPYGGTPIANSIKEASTFVGTKGNNAGIVLLTDGEETCDYLDSIEIAELATENGVSLVNIVGFQLDPLYQTEIREVAQATGGSYYDADDLETLKESLRQAYSSASGDGLDGLNLVCCSTPAVFVLAGIFAFSKNRKKK